MATIEELRIILDNVKGKSSSVKEYGNKFSISGDSKDFEIFLTSIFSSQGLVGNINQIIKRFDLGEIDLSFLKSFVKAEDEFNKAYKEKNIERFISLGSQFDQVKIKFYDTMGNFAKGAGEGLEKTLSFIDKALEKINSNAAVQLFKGTYEGV